MDLLPKTVNQSAIDYLPYLIMPNDLNARNTVFGGRVLVMADLTAAQVAIRHCNRDCVTLSMDRCNFLAPAKQGETLIFKISINRVWGSSMEIGVKVLTEDHLTGESRHVFSSYFTFVAMNENGKPTKARPVVPETEDQKRRYEEADKRRQHRLNEKRP